MQKEKTSVASLLQKRGFDITLPEGWRRPDPEYNCDYCEDKHHVRVDRPVSHPEFGQLHPCTLCHGGQRVATARANLSFGDLPLTLEMYKEGPHKTTRQRTTAEEIAKIAGDLLNHGRGILWLWGKPGTGKSRLAKTILAEGLRRGRNGRYVPSTEFEGLVFNFDDRDRFARLRAPSSILAFDEVDKLFIGSDNQKAIIGPAWHEHILSWAHNEIEYGQSRILVCVSNPAPEDFLSEHAISRLGQRSLARVVHVNCEDRR